MDIENITLYRLYLQVIPLVYQTFEAKKKRLCWCKNYFKVAEKVFSENTDSSWRSSDNEKFRYTRDVNIAKYAHRADLNRSNLVSSPILIRLKKGGMAVRQ